MNRVADISQQKMNMACHREDASEEFWTFSLAFYARPSVAAALIGLQDGAGCDVNLLLFAMWLGLSGRGRLDEHGQGAADRALQTIRTQAIEPLRALRRGLKTVADADLQHLRGRIEALEIEAERMAQHRLARLAGPAFNTEPLERLAHAEANLALCLASRRATGADTATIKGELTRFAEEMFKHPQTVRPSV